MSDFIQIWEWQNAPPEFKEYSRHGGSETWVILIPKEIVKYVLHPFEDIVEGNTDYLNGWGWANSVTLDNGDAVIVFAKS